MANKVDVFTEELNKVFTILQQQYIIIKYMKTLITSGELDETEISKLKEQITLINNQIQHINEKMGIIQNNITEINTKINNNAATITALNKVMPTDVNVDSNGNLILEHDGQEITGQKKQVLIPKWKLNKNNLFASGNPIYISDFYTDYVQIYGETPEDLYINIDYNGINFLLGNEKQFIINYNETKNALEFTDTVNKTTYLALNTDNDMILTDHNVKTINGKSIYGKGDITISGGGKQLFRHRISINTGENGFIFEYICDNKLKVDTPSALKTITNASMGTIILCSILNLGMNVSLNTEGNGIIFDGTNWNYGYVFNGNISNSKLLTFNAIDDLVTPI